MNHKREPCTEESAIRSSNQKERLTFWDHLPGDKLVWGQAMQGPYMAWPWLTRVFVFVFFFIYFPFGQFFRTISGSALGILIFRLNSSRFRYCFILGFLFFWVFFIFLFAYFFGFFCLFFNELSVCHSAGWSAQPPVLTIDVEWPNRETVGVGGWHPEGTLYSPLRITSNICKLSLTDSASTGWNWSFVNVCSCNPKHRIWVIVSPKKALSQKRIR